MDTTSSALPIPAAKKTVLTDKERLTLLRTFRNTRIDIGGDRFWRGIVFGGPGAGKTTFSSRIGDPDKTTIMLDGENSSEVLKGTEYEKKVEAYPFPGVREATELLAAFEADPEIDTLMIDSFTSCDTMEMRDIVATAGFTRPDKTGELYSQQDFGLTLNRWTWLIDVALQTKLNFILVCHERPPSKEEIIAGFKGRTVAGTTNQTKALTTRLGNVIYLSTTWDEKNVRSSTVLTRNTPNTFAKNRMDLPQTMSDDEFIDRVHKWRKGE